MKTIEKGKIMKKQNIALLLTPDGFWDERPAMTSFMETEVQEGINASFNLINAECSNLPYKVLEYNAPHLENPDVSVDKNHELYRNDYELDQFKQALITQTQYTLNIGNDYSQGSSTFSSGGMSATIQRPENRDVVAPGVLKFLQNARLYQLQVYGKSTIAVQNKCDEIDKFITKDLANKRYVHQYQEDATAGQVAFINDNKMVSFADPSNLSFNTLKAEQVLDRDNQYRRIQDVLDLAFYGGLDGALKKSEIVALIYANKMFDENHTYMNEDIIITWNEVDRYIDLWKSKQDNNKGNHPYQDTTFTWWEKLHNKFISANKVWDPIEQVYKEINQFDISYWNGLTKDEIYTAIVASGTTWNPEINYKKGFVVLYVDSTNLLGWYQSLNDINKGNNPETDATHWFKLPSAAIDVSAIIEQLKPHVQNLVNDAIDNKFNQYKTELTTDYKGSEFYFNDENAFRQFINSNPKLEASWFDDVDYKTELELDTYAKLTDFKNYYFKSECDAMFQLKSDMNQFAKKSVVNEFTTFQKIKRNVNGKTFLECFNNEVFVGELGSVNGTSFRVRALNKNLVLNSPPNFDIHIDSGGDVAFFNKRLKNVGAPTENNDAVNKSYVDNRIANIDTSRFQLKSDMNNYYTKVDSDNKFQTSIKTKFLGNIVSGIQTVEMGNYGGGRFQRYRIPLQTLINKGLPNTITNLENQIIGIILTSNHSLDTPTVSGITPNELIVNITRFAVSTNYNPTIDMRIKYV